MSNERIRKKKAKEWNRCPLCGKTLPRDPNQRIVGSSGRAVCSECMRTSFYIQELRKQKAEEERLYAHIVGVRTPEELLEEINQSIIGQERAKKAVATALWKQQLRAKQNLEIPNPGLLLYGPTGCGKTALVRAAAKAAGLPFVAFDATTLTEAGYRGRDADEMVQELVERGGNARLASRGVIFLDEVDKLAAVKGNDYRASYSRGTQHSLLKLIEGKELTVSGQRINTEKILFIFGGAFSGLQKEKRTEKKQRPIGFDKALSVSETEEAANEGFSISDFIDYGMEPELMGRICRCVPLEGLTEEEMQRILLESDLSSYRKYHTFFEMHGQELSLEDADMRAMIRKALERGTGARALNALVEEWMEPKLLEFSKEWKYAPTG